jgi:ribokinase
VAAARLGAEVTFVARLGRDAFGRAAVAAYQSEGINSDFILWDDAVPSGVALIMVDQKAENSIAVAPGANTRLTPRDVAAAEPAIRSANCILVQLEIPLDAVEAAVDLANKHNVQVLLNPAPAVPLLPGLLNKIDIVTPNEKEVSLLAGGTTLLEPEEAARLLIEKSQVKVLVVSLGKKGALIAGECDIRVPAFTVNAVDTTGAGDAFNGGLAVARAQGMKLEDAVRYANAVGALSVTRMGAQPSMPTTAEVSSFLNSWLQFNSNKKLI